MSRRRGFLGEVSWFQLAASVLAAVTAAWIASSLGVAGTLVGAAVGSAVVTLTSAFYARTLDKGRTLLVTTASGTVIQRRVEEDGEIAETIDQAGEEAPVERLPGDQLVRRDRGERDGQDDDRGHDDGLPVQSRRSLVGDELGALDGCILGGLIKGLGDLAILLDAALDHRAAGGGDEQRAALVERTGVEG